jgi:ComF family protein
MNHILPRFLGLFRERLFPAGCASCGTLLMDEEEAFFGLCADCRPRFALDPGPRCANCGRLLISETGVCIPCREGGFSFDRALSLYPYTGRYQELLRAWKFGRMLPLGNFFAARLVEAAASLINLDPDTTGTPVPPRPGKLHATGWDQIRQLAHCLKRAGKPVASCLKRLPSQAQKELDREGRKQNLQGRIVCVKTPPRRVILFDDVITTGATLDACAEALKAGGTEEVTAVSLFYD